MDELIRALERLEDAARNVSDAAHEMRVELMHKGEPPEPPVWGPEFVKFIQEHSPYGEHPISVGGVEAGTDAV